MTPEQNVATIRAALAAFNANDIVARFTGSRPDGRTYDSRLRPDTTEPVPPAVAAREGRAMTHRTHHPKPGGAKHANGRPLVHSH